MSRSKPSQPTSLPEETADITELLEPTPQDEPQADVVTQIDQAIETIDQMVKVIDTAFEPIYQTALYQGLGLNVCPTCGDKKRTGLDGQSICSANREDCTHANPDAI